jgi:hypothetical protein
MKTFSFASPPRASGVYKIHNTKTGQYYIGQSADLRRRFQEWRSVLSTASFSHGSPLISHIAAAGSDDWEFTVLELVDIAELLDCERKHIEAAIKADPDHLLNITVCGKRAPRDPRGNAVFGRLSKVYDEDGNEMTHRDIAERFGISKETVAKKLADLRLKGIFELGIDEYHSQPHASRLKKAA